MKRIHHLIKVIIGALIFAYMSIAYAGMPLWTFKPLTATQISIPGNGIAIVQYEVMNQSSRSRTLVMTPITGIAQITTGVGVCGSSFTLASKGTSCVLSLQINGTHLKSGLSDGPFVCEEGSALQCYSPSGLAALGVTVRANEYTIGGTITGLTGNVTLVNNGTDSLTIGANGKYTLAKALTEGNLYSVTIGAQPANQTCTVNNATGRVSGANVTAVTVTCTTNVNHLGGAVSGLSGSVTLVNNGADALTISSNGNFTFPTTIAEGSSYLVTVQAQPATQTCTVSNGTGIMGGANVTNVTVVCVVNTHTVGGVISGLTGSVTLLNNGTDALTRSSNGSYIFSTVLAEGSTYSVTIGSQPAAQTCTVNNAMGTVSGANVTNVTVTCAANAYHVGGTISGLSGSVTLVNNGAEVLPINSNGTITFPTVIAEGSTYLVTIQIQPATQTCVVSNGTGTMGGANVTNVTVVCTVNTHTVGGVISGLTGSVTLLNNGTDALTTSSNGSYIFATAIEEGSTYSVTISSQPATQTCTVNNAMGTVSGSNVTNITVTCATNTYHVGGTISGLSGSVTLVNNGADALAINSNGSFTFPTVITQGSAYLITVQTQPATQTCVVSNGTGTMGGANVTNVTVVCTVNTHTVGGVISGLTGSVTLLNNGTDPLVKSSNGSYIFATAIAEGSTYSVTISSQPATQTCTVNNATGTVPGANVTNITVTCATNTYHVGGTISGLSGSVTLVNNGAEVLPISSNGSFTFPTVIAQGSAYLVTVQAQPATQTCTVSNGTGTMGGANVTNITVVCTVNTYTVGGMVTGLTGSVTLRNNGTDLLTTSTDGQYTFTTVLTQGSAYSVTIDTQPASQTCTVSNATGTVPGASVTNVNVTCATNSYSVGGTISGLSGSVTLVNNGVNALPISSNGSFTFPTEIAEGSTYLVTVQAQPATQTCSVSNGTGTMGGANVSNVTVVCTVNTYTVGGVITGLTGSVTLLNNGADGLTRSANAAYTFSTSVAEGSNYLVTMGTRPAGQMCSVSNGSGIMGHGNVTNADVNCFATPVTELSVSSTGTIPASLTGTSTNSVTITNIGSNIAYNVSATIPSGWTAVTQDSSGCSSIAVGGSCSLVFSSTLPYIAQGGITISGENISSPPTMALAFTVQGYLVWAISGSIYQVLDTNDLPLSPMVWGGYGTLIGPAAQSLTDGASNTAAIVAALGTGSTYSSQGCYQSLNGGVPAGTWYLMALCQMGGSGQGGGCPTGLANIDTNLVQFGFGGLHGIEYWSSTENSANTCWSEGFSIAGSLQLFKIKTPLLQIRCSRAITL